MRDNRGVTDQPQTPPTTPYDHFGGEAFFERLVAAFYARVTTDPILKPMYPDEDMSGAQWRLQHFLMQYWGGPTTYSDERGHPRLRMRHSPFTIGEVERDRWLSHMRAAMDNRHMDPHDDAEMWSYMVNSAFAMVNQ